MTEEGMSDVYAIGTEALRLHSQQTSIGEWDYDNAAAAVIDALSAAGVLGGVPGEKVTVDRVTAVLRRAQGDAYMPGDDGWELIDALLDPAHPEHDEATEQADDWATADRAALGGDGGTRPKGTQ